MAQPVDLSRFSDRHFWHEGYDKAATALRRPRAPPTPSTKRLNSVAAWPPYKPQQAPARDGKPLS